MWSSLRTLARKMRVCSETEISTNWDSFSFSCATVVREETKTECCPAAMVFMLMVKFVSLSITSSISEKKYKKRKIEKKV